MRALPLTLTLSPKGRGDRSSVVLNWAQVFSLSLWERAGVRGISAHRAIHVSSENAESSGSAAHND
ncbi:hypothetical protein ESCOCK400B_00135 [Escherichia coli]